MKDFVAKKFLSNVVSNSDGCWLWQGKPNVTSGYGRFSFNSKRLGAHVWSYIIFVGPIPDGMQVNHRCNVKMCVNPHHLYAGSHKENMLDVRKANASKSECRHGHELTVDSQYVSPHGVVYCRECNRNGRKKYYQNNADKIKEAQRKRDREK